MAKKSANKEGTLTKKRAVKNEGDVHAWRKWAEPNKKVVGEGACMGSLKCREGERLEKRFR